jgi:hypothetical protein
MCDPRTLDTRVNHTRFLCPFVTLLPRYAALACLCPSGRFDSSCHLATPQLEEHIRTTEPASSRSDRSQIRPAQSSSFRQRSTSCSPPCFQLRQAPSRCEMLHAVEQRQTEIYILYASGSDRRPAVVRRSMQSSSFRQRSTSCSPPRFQLRQAPSRRETLHSRAASNRDSDLVDLICLYASSSDRRPAITR